MDTRHTGSSSSVHLVNSESTPRIHSTTDRTALPPIHAAQCHRHPTAGARAKSWRLPSALAQHWCNRPGT